MGNYLKYDSEYPEENIYESECPVIYALSIVGQKWKLPIMWYLFKKNAQDTMI